MPGALWELREGTSHSGEGKIRNGFLKEVMLELSFKGGEQLVRWSGTFSELMWPKRWDMRLEGWNQSWTMEG